MDRWEWMPEVTKYEDETLKMRKTSVASNLFLSALQEHIALFGFSQPISRLENQCSGR